METGQNKKKRRQSLVMTIMQLSVIPVLLIGLILTIYGRNAVREGMVFETKKSLSGIAHNLISSYNMMDAGDFVHKDGRVFKGETEFTADYRLLDDIKNDTGADVTIFVGNERCLTTVVDKEGNRLINTKVSEEVSKVVLGDGDEYFSENVLVGDSEYYGYYVPIRGLNDEVIGMSFAGKATDSVKLSMNIMLQGNLIICIFIILLAGFICYMFASQIADTIQHIKVFLGGLARGRFNQKMPKVVLKRRDELGEMGEYAVTVRNSLEDMIMKDPLTKLLNRRACLNCVDEQWNDGDLCIMMGDIDFFKRVNDNYGHDVGDDVLRVVAQVMMDEIGNKGFVSRWGGEEFLIVYHGTIDEAYEKAVGMVDRVKQKAFETRDGKFYISMTFGVIEQRMGENFDSHVKRADELLYYGKQHGRNQIVRKDMIKADA